MARMISRNAAAIESPRQGDAEYLLRSLSSARNAPVIIRKKMASTQHITDIVSSQFIMRCHAGRVNRKKPSGLPKIGSTMPLTLRGAYHHRASVGQSSIMVD